MRLPVLSLAAALTLLLAFSASPSAAAPGLIGNSSPSSDSALDSGYGRSDGPAGLAELYFPAQLTPYGSSLLFSEYSAVERPRYYRLGGALRSIDKNHNVKTLALSKRMANSADRMVGLIAKKGIAYTTLGESIISLPLPERSAERNFAIPEGGGIGQTVSAALLGSKELPYDTIAGLPALAGDRDGSGAQSRFSYPAALAIWGGYLLVADRDNQAIRRVDLADGSTDTLLETPPLGPAPALLVSGDNLYASFGAKGVVSLPLDRCPGQACLAKPVADPGEAPVNGIALHRNNLYITSADGVFLKPLPAGGIQRLRGAADYLAFTGGAAIWQDRLYLSDYSDRVIRSLPLN